MKKLHKNCGVALGAMAVALSPVAADFAIAQQGIEDIVVTARKREESLQSVPVSVTSLSTKDLEEQRITAPTDLGKLTPSLRIVNSSSSANSAQIILRGQAASDSLLGISQPVGLYIDSVNVPHPFGANNAFVDIARVEVLKGPQGTLYGRNTTGGAINVITRNADHDGVHGFAEAEIGNFNARRFAGAVNLPLVKDVLAVRLVYQNWDQDGFGKSMITGQRFGGEHNDDTFRATLNFTPSDSFEAVLKFEYGRSNVNGPMESARTLIPSMGFNAYASAVLWQDVNKYKPILFDAVTPTSPTRAASAATIAADGAAILAPCIGQSLYVNCVGVQVKDNVTTYHAALDMNWDVTDNVTLRSITGFHRFANVKQGDLDAVQPSLLHIGYGSDGLQVAEKVGVYKLSYPLGYDQMSEQISQEFNLSGTLGNDFVDWLIGAYASWDDGKGQQNAGALSEFTAVLTGKPVMFINNGTKNITDTWAIFTQNDINITDQLSVTLGYRYTEEKLGINQSVNNPLDVSVFPNVFDCQGRDPVTGDLVTYPAPDLTDINSCANSIYSTGPNNRYSRVKFTGSSWLGSVNFQVNQDILLYGKVSRGFRGGAFGRAVADPAAPEIATDFEVGFKGDLLDGRLRANLAGYWTNYKNKQVSTLVNAPGGAFTTAVINAATARIKGIEAEFQAVPVDGLTLYANGSYTDAKYRKFDRAVTEDGNGFVNAAGVAVGSAAACAPATCAFINAAGLRITNGGAYSAPPWQFAVGGRYEAAMGSGVAGIQLDYSWRGKLPFNIISNQIPIPDDVEKKMMAAVGLMSGRIDYAMEDLGLKLSLWATNLLDKEYGYKGISAGYTANIGKVVVGAPRTFGFTVRKTFGAE